MTKLNITNKRLYKLKKHKNQSKKNMPKKRKNRKRRNRRGGRSFRKRRKYNIKNNSIKKYHTQKGGTIRRDQLKAVENALGMKEHVEASKYKASMITPITDDDGIQKFIILPNVKYVTTKPTGESLDEPYAKTYIDIKDTEPQFQNYFLNNNIKKDEVVKPLLDMIAERLERYIYQIIETDGPDDIYKTDPLKLAALKAIPTKMKELFIPSVKPTLRNSYKEKVNALTFLHWIIDITKNIEEVIYDDDIQATINDETLNTLFYLYVDGYNPNGDLLALEATIKNPFNFSTDDDKFRNAFNMVSASPGLMECTPLLPNVENLSDKLSLAMTKLVDDFSHTWTPEEVVGLNDNKETDGKMAELSTQEEALREIVKQNKENLSKFTEAEAIKVGEIQTKIDELKTKNAVLEQQIGEKKTEGATAKVTQTENEEEATEAKKDAAEEKLTDIDKKLAEKDEKLETQQQELDNQSSEIETLKKSINDCNETDAAKQAELEGKLKSAEDKLAATQAELETAKTAKQIEEDQKQEIQNELDRAKEDVLAAAKKTKQAKENLETAKAPTKIPEGDLLETGEEDPDAEEGITKFFGDGAGDGPKGVIKAPMSADGEVIIYLKRRWDGKFIVSTLGTGGDDGDNIKPWISNLGYSTEAAVATEA